MGRYNIRLTGPDNIHLKHAEVSADKLSACQRVISGQLEMLGSPRRESSLYLPVFKWVNSCLGQAQAGQAKTEPQQNKWMAATRPDHQEAKETGIINANQHVLAAVRSCWQT